jgi:hypothetical protein
MTLKVIMISAELAGGPKNFKKYIFSTLFDGKRTGQQFIFVSNSKKKF